IPGRITRNGKNIFGKAAMSGVRRAAVIDSAAIARCTTRKSVHQYPNDSTKPRPITRPNHSTPTGFCDALPIVRQACVYASGGNPRAAESVESWADSPCQPPTAVRPSQTSGKKPNTIRKNCSTSLYIALVRPPSRMYASTMMADTSMLASKLQPNNKFSNLPRAYIEMPDEKTVITANDTA